jgi:hypothetical protein
MVLQIFNQTFHALEKIISGWIFGNYMPKFRGTFVANQEYREIK